MKRDESRLVAIVLRLGVGVSAALLLAGVILGLAAPPGEHLHVSSVRAIVPSLRSLEPSSLIHAGLLMLMLTPIARVVAVLVEFIRRRELPFVLVSIGVLLLLVMTATFGLWEK